MESDPIAYVQSEDDERLLSVPSAERQLFCTLEANPHHLLPLVIRVVVLSNSQLFALSSSRPTLDPNL